MKLLVVGRSGQVAHALVRAGAARGHKVEALGRPKLDLTRDDDLAALIRARGADVVINTAAFTMVDQAETERESAFAVNAEGAGAVAEAAATAGVPFIQLSTDFVFSGVKPSAYVEEDEVGPINVYGASKLSGEQLVRVRHPKAAIVRTAWVIDRGGVNFVRTMLRLAKSRDEIAVVGDQVGTPTLALDLANAMVTIVETGVESGMWHCANQGAVSRADLAREVFALSQERGGPSADVKTITSAEFPTPARRPLNSSLDCSKLREAYGVRMRPWREALEVCLNEIAATGWRVE